MSAEIQDRKLFRQKYTSNFGDNHGLCPSRTLKMVERNGRYTVSIPRVDNGLDCPVSRG